MSTPPPMQIYKGDGDRLIEASRETQRVVLLPTGDPRAVRGERRIRIQWGQHLLDDLVEGRYRTVICGVNDEDNTHGVLGELLKLIPTSQWSLQSATSYAKMFRNAVSMHAHEDREPYVLKFDLDRLLILALLRPAERDYFTLEDIYRGFRTVSKMLEGRRERSPAASVSFLGAKSNQLYDSNHNEPSLEEVLDAMHKAGYDGDLYPPVQTWDKAPTGVFANFPFPESLERMRQGSS
ncbi:MAG: hypothetical protein MK085_03580 [Phycisphaerales bacterium]|nr:hypothetical protein [Phycisphaerales bacterium]